MSEHHYPPEFLALLNSVSAKRPKTVITHILAHGRITTAELKDIYGYNHPPRAIRDVREYGIPITMVRITGPDGKRIAAYQFGDPNHVRFSQSGGRTALTSRLKTALIKQQGARCHIYLVPFAAKDLQIDHRVPFEIAGDQGVSSHNIAEYMLLCPSANRAKSWNCEHCANWIQKNIELCQTCYWAYPESYLHIAMHHVRRIDLLWSGSEIAEYEQLIITAAHHHLAASEYIKWVLRHHLKKRMTKFFSSQIQPSI